MNNPTFESFVVNGFFCGKPAHILIDSRQSWCTISEGFIIVHSLKDDVKVQGNSVVERFALGAVSISSISGRYTSTWSMSIRSLMDHDICLGADWVNACGIRAEGDFITDPSPSELAALPSDTLWQAEGTSKCNNFSHWELNSYRLYPVGTSHQGTSAELSSCTGCTRFYADATRAATNVTKVLVTDTVNHSCGSEETSIHADGPESRIASPPCYTFDSPNFTVSFITYSYHQPPRLMVSASDTTVGLTCLVLIKLGSDRWKRKYHRRTAVHEFSMSFLVPSSVSLQGLLIVAKTLHAAMRPDLEYSKLCDPMPWRFDSSYSDC